MREVWEFNRDEYTYFILTCNLSHIAFPPCSLTFRDQLFLHTLFVALYLDSQHFCQKAVWRRLYCE